MTFDPLHDTPTLRDLSPPNTDYPYFEGSAGLDFDPEAGDYSPVNAWWLAEAALLAYGGRALADPLLERPTLLQRDQVEIASVDGPDDNGVLLLCGERFVLAAFRGTRVLGLNSPTVFLRSVKPNLTDVLTDLHFRQVPFDSGQVHEGFLTPFRQVEQGLREQLERFSDRPVWFTGHSLGAALATLAAARFGGQGLYTFGSPRVGDGDFAALFAGRPCFRHVHHDDLVARIPPPLVPLLPVPTVYAHVGQLVSIDEDGTVRQDSTAERQPDALDGIEGIAELGQGMVPRASDLWSLLTTPQPVLALADIRVPRNAITDHAPIYYASLLKRALRQGDA